MSLAEVLIPEIQARFKNLAVAINSNGNPCAVFPSPSSEVGTIEISDDGHELTVDLGRLTHVHFENFESRLSETERNKEIVREVLIFLEELFSDQIEFFGSPGGSGGWHRCKDGPRGFFSKLFFGKKSYRWSGPVS